MFDRKDKMDNNSSNINWSHAWANHNRSAVIFIVQLSRRKISSDRMKR